MIVVCYTDASYNDQHDIAACGYCILVDGKMVKHEVILVEGFKGCAQAEVFAATTAIQYAFLLEGVTHIVVYTDCMMITKMKPRGRTDKKYKEYFDTLDILKDYRIGVTVNHVKGHSSNHHNNLVDRNCLQQLRKFIKENG